MTFDSGISTTYGGALADLRDKVSGMTNWGLTEDAASTPVVGGEHFVLSTPTGEYIKIATTNKGGVYTEQGTAYSGSSWDDRFSNDHGSQYANPGNQGARCTAPYDGNGSPNFGDSVTYWMEYTDGEGFGIYMTRNTGDNRDGDMFLGFAEISLLWDVTAATNPESTYVMGLRGGEYAEYDNDYNLTTDLLSFMPEQGVSESSESSAGYGQPNPDGNFSNFPAVERSVVASDVYKSGNTGTILGTHTVWIDPLGGTHQDTVQDDSANNLYTILKDGSKGSIGLRMD